MSRLVALRAGYGVLLLLQPDRVIELYTGHPADRASRAVARLLGARHLTQALLTLGWSPAVVLAMGVEADVAHCASMLGLAALDQRRRRAALVDAVAAGSFAIAGAVLAWRRCVAQRGSTSPATSTRLGTGRTAAATWIATRTLPVATVRALRCERGPMPDNPGGSPVAARTAVDRARTRLLAGRGPGATPTEIARHTRARTVLGGQPVTRQRATLADQTARARGDIDALSEQVAAAGSQLAATMAAIGRKARPGRAAAILRLAVTAAAVEVAVGIGATITLGRRRHVDR